MTVLALCTLGVFGQGGSWYVGGIAGFSTESSDNNNNPVTNMWYFGPEVGTFFNERWSAGLVLGLDGMSQKNDLGDLEKRSAFVPNLYGRRWWSAGERLGIFAGLDASFGMGSTTVYDQDNNGAETKKDMSSLNFNLNAGVAYALAQRWTLLLKFAALGFQSETVGDVKTNTFGLVADGNVTSNQFIFVGLYWNFIQP